MIYIFDLDHTVVDSSHRQATRPDGSLDLDHWREHSTPALIERDSLLPLAHEWRKLHRRGHTIIVCTARVMGPADYFTLARVGYSLTRLSRVPMVIALLTICSSFAASSNTAKRKAFRGRVSVRLPECLTTTKMLFHA